MTFAKYIALRDAGAGPKEVYNQAKQEGLDDVAMLRMLRTVFDLSLADAKRVTDATAFLDQPQEVFVGATVYWEGWDSIDGSWIVKATVAEVRDGYAFTCQPHRFFITKKGFVEAPPSGVSNPIPLAYFQKSLLERLGNAKDFLDQLANI